MKVEQAVVDWLNRNTTPELRKTAEEWFDGRDSAMFRLYASWFKDDVPPLRSRADFLKLRREAEECLDGLQDEFAHDKPGLLAVRKLAINAAEIQRLLYEITEKSAWLLKHGVHYHEVSSVVQDVINVAQRTRAQEDGSEL